jgi:hypothetical protein
LLKQKRQSGERGSTSTPPLLAPTAFAERHNWREETRGQSHATHRTKSAPRLRRRQTTPFSRSFGLAPAPAATRPGLNSAQNSPPPAPSYQITGTRARPHHDANPKVAGRLHGGPALRETRPNPSKPPRRRAGRRRWRTTQGVAPRQGTQAIGP